jgi:hypothetical protein
MPTPALLKFTLFQNIVGIDVKGHARRLHNLYTNMLRFTLFKTMLGMYDEDRAAASVLDLRLPTSRGMLANL